jgi:hypothetical protein
MKKDLAPGFALALAAPFLLSACAGAGAGAGGAAQPVETTRETTVASEAGTPDAVLAGHYRLTLSMTCRSRLETATGVLTLQPMSGDPGANDASLPGPSEAALLWGKTDLDLPHFLRCLGGPTSPVGEPIHPSVLVEVLRWDGERQQQVLLVSTESATAVGSASGIGVAMWVERVQRGHIAGVWSRWELIGRGEGRWEADLLP